MRISMFLALALLGAAQAPAQGNVLLVIADDLGTDKLLSYGARRPPATPRLDALAAGGLQFEQCWANPVCSPTRATIQTGRYSFRTGVGTAIPGGPPLDQAERTLAEALAESGAPHATALLGKWHLGGGLASTTESLDPNRQGYAHFAGLLAGAFAGPFNYERWPRTEDGATTLSRDYATSVNVDDALAWIDDQSGPWFACVSFNAPHTPFHAPPAALHGLTLPPGRPCDRPLPFYKAMVEAMDAEVGRLLDSLDPDVAAATTVIFVADNGTTGDVVSPPLHPDQAKGSLYQGGIRVPLIIAGRGVAAAGRRVSALVNTTDLFVTILQLCGVDPAQLRGGAPADSVSLMPYLRDPTAKAQREHAFAEVFVGTSSTAASATPTGSLQSGSPPTGSADAGCLIAGAVITSGKTIRNATHKLLRFADGREELYDLTNDPRERTDLLVGGGLQPAAQAAYDDLDAALQQLLQSP
ncbi:MAG: sulfatase-like hydrolase/transferase [Planctomycetota bacterium]